MVERADDLVEVVRSYFSAAAHGDLGDWRAQHVPDSGDLRLIGTDEDELFAGDEAREYLASGDGHETGNLHVDIVELEAFREGPIGWVFAQPAIRVGDGPGSTLRWTAVFDASSGGWQLVQIHASRAIGQRETPGRP